MNVRIIAVAGGSGSGKTTLARKLAESLSSFGCAILAQDSYYIDQSAKFDRDGGAVNFDHPDALEFSLLAQHLSELKAGRPIEVPIYDFSTHTRKAETETFPPRDFVLVDGTLILSRAELRPLFDETLFIETSEDLRFARRLRRDVAERGRTPEGVEAQFFGQVKPMHDFFVEPSKAHCGLLVRDGRPLAQAPSNSELRRRLLGLLDVICVDGP